VADIKLDRRTLLIGAGGVGLAAALAPGLSTLFGGGSSSGLRYVQAKREVVDYFTKVAADYNATGPAHPVRMESQAGSLTNGFVRNSNQPAVVNSNFNNEIKLYVEAGSLRDLSDRPAVETLRPDHIEFFRSLANFNDEMSVLPFSVTAAGTIYNKELFAQAGVEIPTTWDEFIAACETFKSKDIVPILGTYADTWTIDLQFGYHMCSTMDVAAFFQAVGDAGVDLGPDSAYSFEKDLPPACERLLTLLSYFQDGFQRVGYDQGNQQFAGGAAAMYFQGPWAFTALNNINPDAKEVFGTFATPGASAADTKASGGLDLCVWIPRSISGSTLDGGLAFLDHLMSPAVIDDYNAVNLAYSSLADAPPQDDPQVSDITPLMDAGQFAPQPSMLFPAGIPWVNLLQQMTLDGNVGKFVRRIDDEYRRRAIRTSA
jgi:raffinose/stachyose/melibiose transport system substrate-binding protein